VHPPVGPGNSQTQRPTDLASRVFNHRVFPLVWIPILVPVLLFISEPVRLVILVYWVYGRDAYANQGIRVIPHKPLHFSDGTRVPQWLDMVTGFGMFFVTTLGLSLALFFALRVYERRFTIQEGPADR